MATNARKKSSKPKTSPYDVAEHLRNARHVVGCFFEPSIKVRGHLLGSIQALSAEPSFLGDLTHPFSASDVAQRSDRALSEGGNPSFATVLKVARALGVRLHAQPA